MGFVRKHLVGQIVNGWLLLEELPFDPPDHWSHQRKYNNRRFLARNVETDYEMESTLTNIRNKRSKTGPRHRGRYADLTGRRVGAYEVIGMDQEAGEQMWKVVDTRTGAESTKSRSRILSHYNYILRTGRVRHLARSKGADLSARQIYSAWQNLKQSTLNKSHRNYQNYGAVGIRMCHRWKHKFDDFRLDIFSEIGERPSKNHCLWPVNPALVMAPGNVQWIQRSKRNIALAKQTNTTAPPKLFTQNTRMEKVTP